MGLTIDWGTMVISVPVIAASCFGAFKFFGEAYFKEYFEKRNASNLQEMKKEYDIFKSKLEKDQEEYIKKLNVQIERNKFIVETYTPKYLAATENVRNEMEKCYRFINTAEYDKLENCIKKEKELKKIFEDNRIYITPNLRELMENFIKLFIGIYNNNLQISKDISLDAKQRIYNDWEKNLEDFKRVHNDIETLVQMELSGQI